jgi:hypothetical protein
VVPPYLNTGMVPMMNTITLTKMVMLRRNEIILAA